MDAATTVLSWIGPLLMMGGFLIGLVASAAAMIKKPLAGGLATAGFLGLMFSSGFDLLFWRSFNPHCDIPWWFYDAYGLAITMTQDMFAATIFVGVGVACLGSSPKEVGVDA